MNIQIFGTHNENFNVKNLDLSAKTNIDQYNDNPNTTQTLEYTRTSIIVMKVTSPLSVFFTLTLAYCVLGQNDINTDTIHYFRMYHLHSMNGALCKGITQTLIPDTSAVKPKASQSTDGNLLWSVVYISDTACLHVGVADDTQPALADPHPLRQPWPVTGGYATGVVRGHPSISLPLLSSPTLPLSICISPTPLHHLQGPHPQSR
jgi:hypothetical protein